MRRARLAGIPLTACALLGACNDTTNLAPASANTPWQFQTKEAAPSPAQQPPAKPGAKEFRVPANTEVQMPAPAEIDPNHVYSLVELIDIAERRNQTTRVAWEQARQAAIRVGMAQAAYLPSLAATALGGYQYINLPFPRTLTAGTALGPQTVSTKSYITSNAQEVMPQLTVKYLLLDFGGREATVEAAKQGSTAANIGFTAVHQQLIFNVARAYFALDGADAAVRAARQALADAQVVQQSADALYGRGLDTIVNAQIARRGVAQAQYDLAQAVTAEHDAMYSLLSAMDLPPTTKLRVENAFSRPLPPHTGRTVDDLLRAALRQRPDLLADVAKLRATDAAIALARSEMEPKLSLNANVMGNIGRLNVNQEPYSNIAKPQAGVFLNFAWPLYQGGLLQNTLRVAQSQHDEAADTLKEHTNQALREVALAYDQVETVLQQYDAAVAFQTASDAAFRSASDAYANGVGTLTDAVNAQTALAAARASVARAHAQSLITAAALAFATGELTSSAAFEAPPSR